MPKKKKQTEDMVALFTDDTTSCLVPASRAKPEALALAEEYNCEVHIRDQVSDKLIGAAYPDGTTKTAKQIERDGDALAIPAFLKRKAPTPEEKKAMAKANKTAPKKLKTPKATPKAKKPKSDGPTGKTAEVIKLALRKNGVTPKELIEKTGWDKAPWKWNFHNPKGTGYAQRFGYDFRTEKKDGQTRYFLTVKKAAAKKAA